MTKKIRLLGACAFVAAGMFTSTYGQLQTAGNLLVDIDARPMAEGVLSVGSIANPGTAAGYFDPQVNAGLGPQVIAVGGNGTHGILLDGNGFLVHKDNPGGSALYAPTILTGTNPVFSVEAWVFSPLIIEDNPVVSWGTRGNCGGQVSCAYGMNGGWGGFAMWCNDRGWPGGTPANGVWHHLVWTVTNNPVELTNSVLTMYADGALRGSSSIYPSVDANNNILIGASHDTTGGTTTGVTAGLIIGRVRIQDGVLSAAQVANNYSFEVATFTNGTPVFLAAKPTHRWSFLNAATNDAVGLTVSDSGTAGSGATAATVTGTYGGATAQFTGTQLYLQGGGSASAPYVDLPNGIFSSHSTNNGGTGKITIEGWVQMQGSHDWARIFDFGSNTLGEITAPGGAFDGDSYFTFTGTPSNDRNNSAIGFQAGNYWFKSRMTGSTVHYAVSWDEATGLITVYENGVKVTSITTPNTFTNIVDVNNWIGRSNWSGDQNTEGYYPEFRIYNRIVGANELLNNFQVGPTVVDPILKWNGNVSGNWDINTTANWLSGTTPVKYNDFGIVTFDDSLTGTANVNVTTTVRPASLLVNNSLSNYTFTGSGKISGTNGLTKSGSGSLTIGGPGLNDFTGAVTLNAGTLVASNLANGGSPSSIGASSASANSLTLAGGTFSYRGAPVTINRGYSQSASATMDLQGDLNFSGQINGTGGILTKSGAAALTYSGAGLNRLGGGVRVGSGTMVVDGSAGQTNQVIGETWVGFTQSSGAALILNNTTYSNTSWIAIGRGNGTGGYTSTVVISNSAVSCGSLSLGYANGIAGNNQIVNMTLNGNTRMWENGDFNLSESGGSVCTININDNSWIRTPNRLLIGMGLNAIGYLNISGNGALTNGGWASIGAPGSGTVTMKDNAIWQALVDFNVTDTAANATYPSVGILNISGNALLRINTLYVGKNAYCTGIINQDGGTVFRNGGGDWRIGGNVSAAVNQLGIWNLTNGTVNVNGANFQIGAYGTGYFNQYGGTVLCPNGYPGAGRFVGGIGYLNVSGGTFNQQNTGTILIVGEQGTGTLNVSGSGIVNANRLGLGWTATGNGTLNLTNGTVNATNDVTVGNIAGGVAALNVYGGTIATRRIFGNGGTGTVNLNGGTIVAIPGANATFMSGLTSATVGGALTLDSGANNITISQNLLGSGFGSLTKLGSGTLTLSGTVGYAGATTVNAGKLGRTITTSQIDGSSVYTFADNTGMNLTTVANQQLTIGGLTLGSSSGATLTFTLNSLAGNPTNAAIVVTNMLTGTGVLTANGTITVNLSAAASGLNVGYLPLIKYDTLAGTANYVMGSKPAGVVATVVTNTVDKSIGLDITAVHILLWTGEVPGGEWDVNISANWTNMLTTNVSTYLQGAAVIFDDSAVGTTTVALNTNVAPSSIAFSNNTLPYTIQGTGLISGAAGLNMYGTNTSLTLATTGNTYSGPSTASGGTLTVTAASALSSNSSLAMNNTALNIGGNNQNVGAFSFANAALAASGGTVTAPSFTLQNATVQATLAGAAPLATAGPALTNVITVVNGNTYTGPTTLGGGLLYATNLANGGVVSSIGASSSNPTNLVFAGGGLSYEGPSTTIDRGYSVNGAGALNNNANLVVSGLVTSTGGGTFVKAGSGTLAYVNPGTNTLTTGIYQVNGGLVKLDGTSSAQVDVVGNEVWVGGTTNAPGALALTNTTLNVGSWLAIGRGNGSSGFLSTVTLDNSVMNLGYASMGYDAGIAGNFSSQLVALNGNSKMTLTGGNTGFGLFVAESVGAKTDIYLNDTSSLTTLRMAHIGKGANATGSVYVASSAALVISNNASIGYSGIGALSLKDNATYFTTGDLNIGDLAGSQGTLNISNNAQMTINNLYLAKSTNTVATVNQAGGTITRVGGGNDVTFGGNSTNAPNAIANYNMSGGSLKTGPVNFQIGAYGTGTFTQIGGDVTTGGWTSIGRYVGAFGTLDVSGGSFSQTNANTQLLIGESGNGTLNVSGAGVVNCHGLGIGWNNAGTTVGLVNINGGVVNVAGPVTIGNGAASATLNLNGGSLTATKIGSGSSFSTLNLNGGTIHAGPGAFVNFLSGVGSAVITSSGVTIDSGAHDITIGQVLNDGGVGSLTKMGSGILTLTAANGYAGSTVISNGTLLVNGSIVSPVQTYSGTFGGNGQCYSPVTIDSGARLAPGSGGVGTLTLYSDLALNGNLAIEVNKSLVSSNDYVSVLGNLTHTGSGTLTVSNLGPALVVGDSFTLFSQPVPTGNTYTIASAPGITWTNRLADNGSIEVLSVAPTIPTIPTNITFSVTGSTLNMSWPASYTGWSLEAQTNVLTTGISTNWHIIPGSSSVNSMSMPVNPNNPTVFYRLVLPQP